MKMKLLCCALLFCSFLSRGQVWEGQFRSSSPFKEIIITEGGLLSRLFSNDYELKEMLRVMQVVRIFSAEASSASNKELKKLSQTLLKRKYQQKTTYHSNVTAFILESSDQIYDVVMVIREKDFIKVIKLELDTENYTLKTSACNLDKLNFL